MSTTCQARAHSLTPLLPFCYVRTHTCNHTQSQTLRNVVSLHCVAGYDGVLAVQDNGSILVVPRGALEGDAVPVLVEAAEDGHSKRGGNRGLVHSELLVDKRGSSRLLLVHDVSCPSWSVLITLPEYLFQAILVALTGHLAALCIYLTVHLPSAWHTYVLLARLNPMRVLAAQVH